MFRVGLLTTRHYPLLPYFLDLVLSRKDWEIHLIFDKKDFGEKNTAIFADRTGGAFPARDFGPYLERVKTVDVDSHNGEPCIDYVERQNLDLLVNLGTPRLLKGPLIGASRLGVLNAHPGILPKYRGATCCEWAIYNDEPVGVSAHFINEGLDSGPIVFTRELPILRGQNYQQVRIGLYKLGLEVAAEGISRIHSQNLSADKLPAQPDAPAFKPIPDELLAEVKLKLTEGRYIPKPF